MLTLIMAGGVGERFWPWSRRKRPKQLLDLTGRGSMIDLTVDRLEGLSTPEEIFIVTNVEQQDAILEQVAGRVPAENIIGEPAKQNTAPCIGLAAVLIRRKYGNRPMLVLPADHLIDPVENFQALVVAARDYVADQGKLLTFGIKPTRPETGYGYIHAGDFLFEKDGARIYHAQEFLEKPDAQTARKFVDDGNYLWNSGMFMWTTDAILGEFSTLLPDLYDILKQIDAESGTRPLPDVLNELYPRVPSISIDYGVMEKSSKVVVIKAEFAWNDVGSWEFMRDVYPEDGAGNVAVGKHIMIDAANNTVVSPDRTVAVLGIDDIVVVDAGDTVLVCRRDRAQEVKQVVKSLRQLNMDDLI